MTKQSQIYVLLTSFHALRQLLSRNNITRFECVFWDYFDDGCCNEKLNLKKRENLIKKFQSYKSCKKIYFFCNIIRFWFLPSIYQWENFSFHSCVHPNSSDQLQIGMVRTYQLEWLSKILIHKDIVVIPYLGAQSMAFDK